MVLAAGLRGVRRVRLVVFKHCDLRAAGRRRRAYQPAELLLYYAHLVWPERAGLPWRFVGAVQPAERAVPALLVAAGARPDELVPGGSGRLPALHSGVDLRGHCADGVARRQGVPQQKAGYCLPLPAADDVQRLADSTGNSLYSYGALVQSTLLPALVAGLAVLRWQDTGHKRWAVLAGYCMFQCCAHV